MTKKKIGAIALVVLVIGGVSGWFYWQSQKKAIVKDKIETAIEKGTDSLYYIHYDSSKIDELTGSASFYNVTLQSDSAQKAMLESTDSLPNALYSVSVESIKATGLDVVGLLQKQNLTASKIILTKPVIQITNTGSDQPKQFTFDDTLALYKKILGKFKTIRAENIDIVNGNVVMLNRKGKPLTTLENINVSLHNFLVDSQHNYENIVSYFVKDVHATVENIQLPESRHKHRINVAKVDYDAFKKTLHVGEIQQYETNNTKPLISLKNINITQLNTDAFILNQRLKAGMITCDGGLITITKRGNAAKAGNQIELFSDFVEQAQIGGLNLGNTKIVIIDSANKDAPFVLNDVRFIVSKVINITEGATISNVINNAEWQLFSSGFSKQTKDDQYKLTTGAIKLDNATSTINVKSVTLKALASEAEFVKQSTLQRDMFDLSLNNIQLSGVNFKKLIGENSLEADNGSMQSIIKVFNDRTLPPDTKSKVGKYPHQMLLAARLPVYIKSLRIVNGNVSYRERSVITEEIGNTFFTNLNATISNVTNVPERIRQNNVCKLVATTSFLGKAAISTEWDLKLDSKSGEFNMKAEMGQLQATDLNKLSEPMALLSLKQGRLNKLAFDITGDDNGSKGDIEFLYDDVKVSVLKKQSSGELKKRGAISLLANFVLLNSNPQGKKVRDVNIEYKRDPQRSFFNLVWKSVFDAAQRITRGKD